MTYSGARGTVKGSQRVPWMKFWIIPIAIGLLVGVGYAFLFHHGGDRTMMLERFHGAMPIHGPSTVPSSGISPTMKVGAIIAGILLAFIPNATVKQIGAGLSAAGIGALFAAH